MAHDGNVAFKVTWVYGEKGRPFASACTSEGREINSRLLKKTWCTQPQNNCYKVLKTNNRRPPVEIDESDIPCYDAVVFRWWAFASGVFHHGAKRGQPIPMRFVRPGKLAFLTSRNHEMSERNRLVIGCFRISEVCDEDGSVWAVSEPGPDRIRVTDLSRAPRYWDYHKQTGGPRWGTGLFRYLPDTEAQRLFLAVHKAAKR